MKKIILIILVLVGLFAFGFYFFEKRPTATTLAVPTDQTPLVSTPPEEVITEPTRLEIPAINVDAEFEYVGLDAKRNMDVPKAAENVGWYNLGPKPGEVGSAVIAGHLDDPNGNPAVFWDLANLKIGDEIKITDKNDVVLSFIVKDVKSYETDKFPLNEVFADTSGKKLNLITCEGTFDKVAKSYSRRTVVYSELSE